MHQEIEIYLTSPEHYLYDELLNNAPEKVSFHQREVDTSSIKDINSKNLLKNIKNKFLHRINNHLVLTSTDYNLVHSNGALVNNTNKNWIIDFEDGTAFSYLKTPNKSQKENITNSLKSENCKKLLPHCKAAKESFYSIYNPSEDLKEKTEVVYPAFHAPENHNINTDKISLLFVAREFERKGGYEALNAFKQLQEDYSNIEFICVSDIPEEVAKQKLDNVRFYSNVERNKLYKLYQEADIFVYPTFHDTFGLVMLEAMAFGNPVVTIEDFATPEIVNNSEDGFLIEGYNEKWFEYETKVRINKYNNWKNLRKKHGEHEKTRIVNSIVEKCSIIIEDESKLAKFSENAREKIESGKFSIKKRNQKLSRIYRNAAE